MKKLKINLKIYNKMKKKPLITKGAELLKPGLIRLLICIETDPTAYALVGVKYIMLEIPKIYRNPVMLHVTP